ncbi:MAG: phosphohydrolase [Betaproteobacteria bacterium]|nr:MAG: phosphohydrolase [Betaproteobacteria bacterium]
MILVDAHAEARAIKVANPSHPAPIAKDHPPFMHKSMIRFVLFYGPIIALITFVAVMLIAPRDIKILAYRHCLGGLLWLFVPYVLLAFVQMRLELKRRAWLGATGAALAIGFGLVLLYARFIEPERIVIRETQLSIGAPLRIALIADVHIGFFQDERRTQQIVDALNRLDVDVVAVAGDWTYEPTRPLGELLAPLSGLRHRMISVPGNHDEEQPGPPLAVELRETLLRYKVEPVEGKSVIVKGVEFVGMGDRWAKKDWIPPLIDDRKPLIALAHNPDSYVRLAGTSIGTMLAGHTHGGQINIPWLTAWALTGATKGAFKRGLYERDAAGPRQVFVTAGLGTVGLPMRLFQPPVIDVLICK